MFTVWRSHLSLQNQLKQRYESSNECHILDVCENSTRQIAVGVLESLGEL